MFTLAISCLTTSNLPWFMDLTFQVSMQYCSLQRQILLSSPDISTTEASFPLWPIYFILPGAISSSPPLFPSSILDTFWLGGLIFQCHIILPFYTVHGVLTVSILEWFTIHSSSGPRFVRTLHFDLGCPHTAQLMASLSYASPFTKGQWPMKGLTEVPVDIPSGSEMVTTMSLSAQEPWLVKLFVSFLSLSAPG